MKLKNLLIIMFLTVSMIPIVIIGGVIGLESTSLALIGTILILTLVVSIVISFFVTRPLEKLTRNIDEISKGNLDVTLEKSEIYEINKLTGSLDRVMASLKLAIHKVGVKRGEIFEETMKAKTEAEEKYQNLLKSIDDWAWKTDDKGVYISCSDKVTNALGYTPEEIIGKSIYDFMSAEEAKRIKTTFNEHEKRKEPLQKIEMWFEHKNGRKICVLMNGFPIYDESGKISGYRGVKREISELKNAEEKIVELDKKILEMKGRVRDVLNENRKTKTGKKKLPIPLEEKWSQHEFDSVFLFDDQANILDCNEHMYKTLGYTKSEMLSLNITDFDVLQTKEDLEVKINKIKKTGEINFKTIHKRKDGSAIPVKETMQYLKDKGTFKCIITEEK